MAIILKKGSAHKHMAWFTTCGTCESKLKILDGDPCSTPEVCYNCDANQYYMRYICPVCGEKNVAFTSSSFGIEGNAIYKEIVLKEEDREDMRSWNDKTVKGYSKEELDWIMNRSKWGF